MDMWFLAVFWFSLVNSLHPPRCLAFFDLSLHPLGFSPGLFDGRGVAFWSLLRRLAEYILCNTYRGVYCSVGSRSQLIFVVVDPDRDADASRYCYYCTGWDLDRDKSYPKPYEKCAFDIVVLNRRGFG